MSVYYKKHDEVNKAFTEHIYLAVPYDSEKTETDMDDCAFRSSGACFIAYKDKECTTVLSANELLACHANGFSVEFAKVYDIQSMGYDTDLSSIVTEEYTALNPETHSRTIEVFESFDGFSQFSDSIRSFYYMDMHGMDTSILCTFYGAFGIGAKFTSFDEMFFVKEGLWFMKIMAKG